jgi:hypothetical protein
VLRPEKGHLPPAGIGDDGDVSPGAYAPEMPSARTVERRFIGKHDRPAGRLPGRLPQAFHFGEGDGTAGALRVSEQPTVRVREPGSRRDAWRPALPEFRGFTREVLIYPWRWKQVKDDKNGVADRSFGYALTLGFDQTRATMVRN